MALKRSKSIKFKPVKKTVIRDHKKVKTTVWVKKKTYKE